MNIPSFLSFSDAIKNAEYYLRDKSYVVHANRWQGVSVASKPEMAMHEVLNHSLSVKATSDLDKLREDIKPNLPWADDHFQERVAGEPLNPGDEWRNWPYALSADKFRTENSKFTHTYMERYWPRYAGDSVQAMHGIRYLYGDLRDVIEQLAKEPDTRQAYMPIWFPEDTGVKHRGRVPCTLGYHFIMRDAQLHCTYYLRSCDFVRHFRDDIYMTVRLQLHILDALRKRDPLWDTVQPGVFTMHIVSLHMFKNDYNRLFRQGEKQ